MAEKICYSCGNPVEGTTAESLTDYGAHPACKKFEEEFRRAMEFTDPQVTYLTVALTGDKDGPVLPAPKTFIHTQNQPPDWVAELMATVIKQVVGAQISSLENQDPVNCVRWTGEFYAAFMNHLTASNQAIHIEEIKEN